MDLRELINAIEELFYNFVAWIALYPKTVLATLFRPGRMQHYVSDEWKKTVPERFRSHLNPFIFWFLSMILFIWSTSGPEGEEATPLSFEAFTLSMVVFAILPVIFASLMVIAHRESVTIDLLRRPLYIQMLVFGTVQTLLALEMAVSVPLISFGEGSVETLEMLVLLGVSLMWFVVLGVIFLWIPVAEIRIFMKELDKSWLKVLGWVLLGSVLCILLAYAMPFISEEIDLVSSMLQFQP